MDYFWLVSWYLNFLVYWYYFGFFYAIGLHMVGNMVISKVIEVIFGLEMIDAKLEVE